MTNNAERKALITRYLLGQVPENERAEFEEEYLRDDDLFEEMVAHENDLIDAYVGGELAATDREQFETYFMSDPEGHERVELARTLLKSCLTTKASEERSSDERGDGSPVVGFRRAPVPAMRLALAAVLLVAVAGLTWMALMNWNLHRQLEASLNAEQQAQELRRQVAALQERAAAAEQKLAELPPPGLAFLSMTLAPDLARGPGQQTTLHLAPGISEVFLLLRRNHDKHLSYRVILETAEGKQVWQKPSLEPQLARDGGEVIVVDISSSILKQDDYVLRLFGATASGSFEETGTYSFRVLKQ